MIIQCVVIYHNVSHGRLTEIESRVERPLTLRRSNSADWSSIMRHLITSKERTDEATYPSGVQQALNDEADRAGGCSDDLNSAVVSCISQIFTVDLQQITL